MMHEEKRICTTTNRWFRTVGCFSWIIRTCRAREGVGHLSANSKMAATVWCKDKRFHRTLKRNPELLKGWQTRGICNGWRIHVNGKWIVNTSSQAMFCDEETRPWFETIVRKRTILHASAEELGKNLGRVWRIGRDNVGSRDAVPTKAIDGIPDRRFRNSGAACKEPALWTLNEIILTSWEHQHLLTNSSSCPTSVATFVLSRSKTYGCAPWYPHSFRSAFSYDFMKCLCQGRNCPLHLDQVGSELEVSKGKLTT